MLIDAGDYYDEVLWYAREHDFEEGEISFDLFDKKLGEYIQCLMDDGVDEYDIEECLGELSVVDLVEMAS